METAVKHLIYTTVTALIMMSGTAFAQSTTFDKEQATGSGLTALQVGQQMKPGWFGPPDYGSGMNQHQIVEKLTIDGYSDIILVPPSEYNVVATKGGKTIEFVVDRRTGVAR
jgi:hypothetical protein